MHTVAADADVKSPNLAPPGPTVLCYDANPVLHDTYWTVFQTEAGLGVRVNIKMIDAVCIPYLGKCPTLEPWDRLHIRLKLKSIGIGIESRKLALHRSDSNAVGMDVRL